MTECHCRGKGQNAPKGQKRLSCSKLKVTDTLQMQEKLLLLNHTEESKLGVSSRTKVVSRGNFNLNDPSVWQGKHMLLLVPREFLSTL